MPRCRVRYLCRLVHPPTGVTEPGEAVAVYEETWTLDEVGDPDKFLSRTLIEIRGKPGWAELARNAGWRVALVRRVSPREWVWQ